MKDDTELIIHTDGAARGNPGPAAYAYTIAVPGGETIEEAGCLGRMTNNQAEYIALVKALQHAANLGTQHRLKIHSDSELLVKQMNGQYRVKDSALRKSFEQAGELAAQFPEVTILHVRRENNVDADRLCNEALDGLREPLFHLFEPEKPPSANPQSNARARLAPVALPADSVDPAPAPTFGRDPRVRQKVLALLAQAALDWADGDPNDPSPESVLDEIWNLLAESANSARGD